MKYFTNPNKLKSKYNKPIYKRSDDDEDDDSKSDKFLGYFTQTQSSTCLTIPIDEGVREPSYYRHAAQAIANTTEGDIIEFDIASPGGRLDGLLVLLTAMERTEATKVAHINSDCHSAASMLALSCDQIYVSPYASMLVHHLSYGSAGKAADVRAYVNHVHDTGEKLFRETYELFLTEEEIDKVLGGFELWCNSEDIVRRLTLKYEALEKMEADLQELENESKDENIIEPEPKSKVEPEVECHTWPTILHEEPVPKKRTSKRN